MPSLIVKQIGASEEKKHGLGNGVTDIGRLPENGVTLPSKGVSRRHAEIIIEDDSSFIMDMGSGNGTFINGTRIEPNEKNLIKNGDIITIDEYQLFFNESDDGIQPDDDEEEATDTDILEIKLLKNVLSALDKETVPSIEVLNGSAEGKKFYFADDVEEIIIGRDPDCDFPINEYVISRRHARISKRWGGIAIRDLDSKNGSYLNNRRVIEEFLHDGDRIALGTIVIIFRNPQEINLANLADIKPKNLPAPVSPNDIPEANTEDDSAKSQSEDESQNDEFEKLANDDKEMEDAENEWNQLEEQSAEHRQENYPRPQIANKKSLTPMEIGMIGLGALVILFAIITIINIMFS